MLPVMRGLLGLLTSTTESPDEVPVSAYRRPAGLVYPQFPAPAVTLSAARFTCARSVMLRLEAPAAGVGEGVETGAAEGEVEAPPQALTPRRSAAASERVSRVM